VTYRNTNITDINAHLKEIEKKLGDLDLERKILERQRADFLRTKSIRAPVDTIPTFSTNQKVSLFRDLFKGRSDVFANYWSNSKGRTGYSVACHNEWVNGVCNKPKVKCSECPHSDYKTLSSQEIFNHLSGKQTIGIYPLLPDNTCHLLAADFDKASWQDEIKAMSQTCRKYKIPHAVEISRSGNGAHLWLFFAEPVPAKTARSLGFRILDKTMDIHPTLSFKSYDRLFPNQDTMPEGGFGNLIALPLQQEARQQGKSVFVDEGLMPYLDQWYFLSQIRSISFKELTSLLINIAPQSQLAIDSKPPWEQGQIQKPVIIENCPNQITITLANHLYIKLCDFPTALAAQIKRIASFSNPVFFKTQALRFSTHGIPRYITCAQIEQGYLFLPRGCLDDVISLIKTQGVKVKIADKRVGGHSLENIKFLGRLRIDQKRAVKVMINDNTGVLHAPTAFGKTVVAIGIIAHRKVNTLILTHSRQLLDQWQERLLSFLGNVNIGKMGGGKQSLSGQIDVATYQSLINKKDNTIKPIIQEYGQIIIDECHHISAPRYEMVLNEVRAKYVLGLTATPERQDGHQRIVFMLAGPVRYKVKAEFENKFEQKVIVTNLNFQPPENLLDTNTRPKISEVYRWLTESEERTRHIVTDVIEQVRSGRHPLILTERRIHADQINRMLLEKNTSTALLKGAMSVKNRKSENEKLASAEVVIATGRYIGEGFDDARLDTLFLALPVSWKGTLVQYTGRLHRLHPDKTEVRIYDYVDADVPVLARMFSRRLRGYRAIGYSTEADFQSCDFV